LLLARAELEFETGRPTEAERTCERVLDGAQGPEHLEAEAKPNRILGRIARARGGDAAAESLLRTSVGQAGQIGDPYERGLSLLALAEVYATATDPAVGRGAFRRTLRQATCALSSVGARAALERARELEARIQSAPSRQ
jgi:hypothetical protein